MDMVLVGDSGAMTVLGYPSTVAVTTDEMLVLTKAARRGVEHALLVADLPFGSYEVSDEQAIATAVRFVKEAGADAVKLERGDASSISRARAIVGAGIPVVGHVGLTPQTATSLGGYRAQGRNAESALRIARGAVGLQEAGCFCIVFEAVPSALTAELMPHDDGAGHRHRGRAGDGRPGAGVPRPARHPGRARGPSSSAATPTCRTPWPTGWPVREGGSHRYVPGRRARLRRRQAELASFRALPGGAAVREGLARRCR